MTGLLSFYLGGPAPCGRRRAIRSTALRSCRSYPCRDRASGAVSVFPFCRGGEPTRNTPPVLPRHTCRQVLSSNQRAAVGHTTQPFPTLHVGLLKFAPYGSMSMMNPRRLANSGVKKSGEASVLYKKQAHSNHTDHCTDHFAHRHFLME